MTAKTLRLILGDQLNASHSWYQHTDDSVLYLIAELHQEAHYVKHHIQKLCAFFAAMSHFAAALSASNHRVLYLNLDETQRYADLPALLQALCAQYHCSQFEYQRPDEKRLLWQLRDLTLDGIGIHEVDTEHFLLPFTEINHHFKPKKLHRMESFYRKMRKRFKVLMEDDQPEGGTWNYDANNRKKLRPADLAKIPPPLLFSNDVSDIIDRLDRHQINYFGEVKTELPWPCNRQQSLQLLRNFCESKLAFFGEFQDAMTDQSAYSDALYHSRLSFALNAKILHPLQVIQTAVNAYQQSKGQIRISQIEGFVRQVLGWREFVRGLYWANASHYDEQNYFNATQPLPNWFWNGNTRMNCMRHALQQSLTTAYAHHIQRLLVTGNFCLLAGIEPNAVEAWYLGIYIDAIEWVEQPNTRSMVLFADGGWLASKPYAASANYINNMSDYCKHCVYNPKSKTDEHACPLNSLYWNFLHQHQEKLATNPRMALAYRHWNTMDTNAQAAIIAKASQVMNSLEHL